MGPGHLAQYRLTRGADHIGPTLIPRMREMYAWLGGVLGGSASPQAMAQLANLRAQIEPLRQAAARVDGHTNRRYGVLPDSK